VLARLKAGSQAEVAAARTPLTLHGGAAGQRAALRPASFGRRR